MHKNKSLISLKIYKQIKTNVGFFNTLNKVLMYTDKLQFIPSFLVVLLRLNQMLYALCLSYHSNTEVVLFACLSSGWATTTSRLLGP